MLQTLLQKRSNGYYYFRWVCSPVIRNLIGKREIIKSLHTTSKIQALARAGSLYMAVDQLKDIERRLKNTEPLLGGLLRSVVDYKEGRKAEADHQIQLKKVCSEVLPGYFQALKELAKTYKAPSLASAREKRQEINERLLAHCEASTNYQGEYDGGLIFNDMVGELAEAITPDIADLLENPAICFDEMKPDAVYSYVESHILHLISQLSYSVFYSGGNYQTYIQQFERSMAEYLSAISNRLDPQAQKSQLLSAENFTSSDRLNYKQENRLNALYKEFIDHKLSYDSLKPKMKTLYDSYFSIVIHFIGDVPIEGINKQTLRECLQSYSKLPVRNKKAYKGKSIAELVRMSVPKEDQVSAKTVLEVKKLLQGIFRFAVDKGYLVQSPAVDLNLNFKVEKKKAAYSRVEVSRLLKAAIALGEKDEQRKWIVLLGGYTGARLGEICQLRMVDIKLDLESGIQYLRITSDAGSVKTGNANRLTPLHSKLFELGFEDYLALVGDDGRLFPSYCSHSKKITSWFPSFQKKNGIPKMNDFNQSRTFHSLRHSFITELRGNGHSLDLVQAIVGHEKTSAGQTDIYTGHFTVDKLKPVVESLGYL